MKNDKPRRERVYDKTVCLQRDSLDLYVDDVLCASQPISHTGMLNLKGIVNDVIHSHTLFQIKIRNSVQWESRPTQADFSYDM
jgi:hypothetical protein